MSIRWSNIDVDELIFQWADYIKLIDDAVHVPPFANLWNLRRLKHSSTIRWGDKLRFLILQVQISVGYVIFFLMLTKGM